LISDAIRLPNPTQENSELSMAGLIKLAKYGYTIGKGAYEGMRSSRAGATPMGDLRTLWSGVRGAGASEGGIKTVKWAKKQDALYIGDTLAAGKKLVTGATDYVNPHGLASRAKEAGKTGILIGLKVAKVGALIEGYHVYKGHTAAGDHPATETKDGERGGVLHNIEHGISHVMHDAVNPTMTKTFGESPQSDAMRSLVKGVGFAIAGAFPTKNIINAAMLTGVVNTDAAARTLARFNEAGGLKHPVEATQAATGLSKGPAQILAGTVGAVGAAAAIKFRAPLKAAAMALGRGIAATPRVVARGAVATTKAAIAHPMETLAIAGAAETARAHYKGESMEPGLALMGAGLAGRYAPAAAKGADKLASKLASKVVGGRAAPAGFAAANAARAPKGTGPKVAKGVGDGSIKEFQRTYKSGKKAGKTETVRAHQRKARQPKAAA
jgi:hypothetical protein